MTLEHRTCLTGPASRCAPVEHGSLDRARPASGWRERFLSRPTLLYPEMACTPAVDRPISVLLTGGNYVDGGTAQGHGTIVLNGDLTFQSSNFIYYGTIVVNGTVTITNSATIYGGLIARNIGQRRLQYPGRRRGHQHRTGPVGCDRKVVVGAVTLRSSGSQASAASARRPQ